MKILSILSILFFSLSLNAQSYRVYFTDKGENEALFQNPYTFLSPAAVARKALRNTVIDRSDLPVSAEYIRSLKQLDLTVEMKSRWFNYALVSGENVVAKVSALPFVTKVEETEKYRVHFAGAGGGEKITSMLEYGASANQIKMLNGDYLHDLNNLGQGMTIAVLDGGFTGTNTISGLDSLRESGRLLGTYNFVNNDTNIFVNGKHGTNVLTILAGYIDSAFVGSAIGANYWLLQSENELNETAVEMDNWLAAAEFADSVGADIITTSLGYNTFDDGVGDLDYSDMDGNTALVTRAADMAAQKGILVVTSAGNEGNAEWKHILAPADGDSVLTIGGVDENGNYVSFASQGPTADGRIKPDVSAKAAGTAFVSVEVRQGNGTSFSCPVVSGLAACLWQQDPSRSNMEIFNSIRTTASQYYNPDNLIGFGIPDFAAAAWTISNPEEVVNSFKIDIYPNPVGSEFYVLFHGLEGPRNISVTILDLAGKEMGHFDFPEVYDGRLNIKAPEAPGAYLLSIRIGDQVHLRKIVK